MTKPNLSSLALMAAAGASLGLAACNNPADDTMEQEPALIEEQAEQTPDAVEEEAGTLDDEAEELLEDRAGAIEGAGEGQAEAREP